jgi:hypothetical protein
MRRKLKRVNSDLYVTSASGQKQPPVIILAQWPLQGVNRTFSRENSKVNI